MRVVYKYGTGHEIPKSAKYLSTQVETVSETVVDSTVGGVAIQSKTTTRNILVWHYYEVEIEPGSKERV